MAKTSRKDVRIYRLAGERPLTIYTTGTNRIIPVDNENWGVNAIRVDKAVTERFCATPPPCNDFYEPHTRVVLTGRPGDAVLYVEFVIEQSASITRNQFAEAKRKASKAYQEHRNEQAKIRDDYHRQLGEVLAEPLEEIFKLKNKKDEQLKNLGQLPLLSTIIAAIVPQRPIQIVKR